MTDSRLTFALDHGLFALPPEGRVAVFRPTAEADLSALPRARVAAIQGFRPDHDALAARGYAVTAEPEGRYAAAVVMLPRSREEARALLAEAVARLPEGAPVVVDGARTDGVDSLLRELRGRVALSEALAKAHGKIAVFPAPGPAALADWQARPAEVEGFRTLPGVFSAGGVDRGSALLAAALPERMPGLVADLGAGWGYLAARILTRPEVRELHLVEAEKAALDCARVNVPDPRARFHWADATRFAPGVAFDNVVANPPFHRGRTGDPGLGAAFIRAAAGLLAGHGQFWMVANRHLPYEAVLATQFREVEEIGGDGGFKLTRASRPVRAAGPRR